MGLYYGGTLHCKVPALYRLMCRQLVRTTMVTRAAGDDEEGSREWTEILQTVHPMLSVRPPPPPPLLFRDSTRGRGFVADSAKVAAGGESEGVLARHEAPHRLPAAGVGGKLTALKKLRICLQLCLLHKNIMEAGHALRRPKSDRELFVGS